MRKVAAEGCETATRARTAMRHGVDDGDGDGETPGGDTGVVRGEDERRERNQGVRERVWKRRGGCARIRWRGVDGGVDAEEASRALERARGREEEADDAAVVSDELREPDRTWTRAEIRASSWTSSSTRSRDTPRRSSL